MVNSIPMDGKNHLVGTLVRWDPAKRMSSDSLDIFSQDEVFIGRDKKTCQFIIEGKYISNRHLRIYTVLYDEDRMDAEVPPLVYAEDLSLNGSRWNNRLMGQGKGGFLLSDGDILTIMPDVHLRFRSVGRKEEGQFTLIQRGEMRGFHEAYAVTSRVLGEGAQGRVHMAIKQGTGQQLACKIIDLVALRTRLLKSTGADERSQFLFGPHVKVVDPSSVARQPNPKGSVAEKKIESFHREAMILSRLSHPNIISLEMAFRSNSTIYLFSELGTAGDLFSFVQYKGGRLEDLMAAFIMHQILLGLDYLHDRDIVHRDIKPDNILISSRKDGGRIILTDFGCAKKLNPPAKRTETVAGTVEYCAPEARVSSRAGYTKAADLWSVGCVTAVLLVGNPPFEDPCSSLKKDFAKLEANLKSMKIGMRPRDFLLKLLSVDETKRMNTKQGLSHRWLDGDTSGPWIAEHYQEAVRYWQPKVRTEPVVVDLPSSNSQLYQYPANTARVTGDEETRQVPIDCISESSSDEAPDHATASLPSAAAPACLPLDQRLSRIIKIPDRSHCLTAAESQKASHLHHQSPSQRPTGDKKPEFLSDITKETLKPNLRPRGLSPEPLQQNAPLYPWEEGYQWRTHRVTSSSLSPSEVNPFVANPAQTPTQHPPSAQLRALPLGLGLHEQMIVHHTTLRAKRKSEKEDIDQVYEDVRNPITGKRKRRIYGQDVDALDEYPPDTD